MRSTRKIDTAVPIGAGLEYVRGRLKVRDSILNATAGSGEANTAANVGTGSGVYKEKSGVELRFRKIKGQNNVAVSVVSDDVVIDGAHNHDETYEPANANIQSHISSTGNPHGTTADQVLPAQTGHDGKYLKTNGATASWAAVEGGSGLSQAQTLARTLGC